MASSTWTNFTIDEVVTALFPDAHFAFEYAITYRKHFNKSHLLIH